LFLGVTRNISLTNIDLDKCDKNIVNLLNQLNTLNNTLHGGKKEISLKKLDGVIDKLPKNDVMIFIPTGCYKYITSFIDEKTVNKIMLWEFHANKDVLHSNKYLSKEIYYKKCLIIDKSYTGETLNTMSNLVIKNGGIPIKLAIFPKSKLAIEKSDYIFLLDRIFKSDKMKLENNWVETYFKKILNISY
jgi:hypothetical protein